MKTQNCSIQASGAYITPDHKAQIDWKITRRGDGKPYFTATGNFDGSGGQCLESIAEAYPKDKSVMRLVKLWRLHHLNCIGEDTASALSVTLPDNSDGLSFYDRQAKNFVEKNHLTVRITKSNTKTANWSPSGHHYCITISRNEHGRLAFDYWGSVQNKWDGKALSFYDVLTCVSASIYCPETLEDFCSEYGYKMKTKEDAKCITKTFRESFGFSCRIRSFFTPAELEQLAEIQ